MARIAIIGGSDDDKLRDELVEKVTRELIAKGHQVFHGGINSGVMKACQAGGGKGIVHADLISKEIAQKDAMNVSCGLKFVVRPQEFLERENYFEADFGPAIRRQLLTKECDLMIAFPGGIGTFDEIVGRLKERKKILFMTWPYLPAVQYFLVDQLLKSDRKNIREINIRDYRYVMESIFSFLEQ